MTEGGGLHWLLIRRRVSDGEYAFYRVGLDYQILPRRLAGLEIIAG